MLITFYEPLSFLEIELSKFELFKFEFYATVQNKVIVGILDLQKH